MTVYQILLELIRMRSHFTSLYRVTQSLGAAVQECCAAVEKAHSSGNDDYFDLVIGEEADVIETLLGVAFVTCQADISAVSSHAKRIHQVTAEASLSVTISDGTKTGIMALASPIVGESGYTQIQVINAFANYFKHSDEWGAPWSRLKREDQRKTADIVLAVGGHEGGSNNLNIGAKALGVQDHEVQRLAEIVQAWSRGVHRAYEVELNRLRLL